MERERHTAFITNSPEHDFGFEQRNASENIYEANKCGRGNAVEQVIEWGLNTSE